MRRFKKLITTKEVTYCISSSVNFSPESLLHLCSQLILASSKWADVYSITHFSRGLPLKLDLFPTLTIFVSLHNLSPAPFPRRFEVTQQATNPSTQV